MRRSASHGEAHYMNSWMNVLLLVMVMCLIRSSLALIFHGQQRVGRRKLYHTTLLSSTPSWTSWEFGEELKEDEDGEAKEAEDDPTNAAQNVYSRRQRKLQGTVLHQKTGSKADKLWSKMSDKEVERGIACLSQFATDERLRATHAILSQRTDNVRMVFENPGNINNVWAALRTFDSFGVQFVDCILDENLFTFNVSKRKNHKGKMNHAMGTQKWLTLTEHASAEECVSKLKEDGYTVYITDFHRSSISIKDLIYPTNIAIDEADGSKVSSQKIALVMGNEVNGISDAMRGLADHRFHIPMRGFAESFNVSAASAIICSVLDMNGWLRPSFLLPSTPPTLINPVDPPSITTAHIYPPTPSHGNRGGKVGKGDIEDIKNIEIINNKASLASTESVEDIGSTESIENVGSIGTTSPSKDTPKFNLASRYTPLGNRIALTWLSRSVSGALPLMRREGLPVLGNSLYDSIGGASTKP